jgi:SAM-dependent methyltransferase
MTAIDISSVFIAHAQASEAEVPLGIEYQQASAVALPFPEATFDFATGFMSFMDIPETETVLAQAFRVLKPGGFLQFSILHPCFMTPHRRNLRDAQRRTYAIEVGDYFRPLHGAIEEWIFLTTPEEMKRTLPKFRVPRFNRTMSDWLNLVIATGFTLERIEEPTPSDETVRKCPELQDAQVVAYFLHVRARKPQGEVASIE